MNRSDLLAQIALGEDSTRQLKADIKNADSLASKIAAFANTNGGTIFIGVADDGSTRGLSGQDVARINQLISNAANLPVNIVPDVSPKADTSSGKTVYYYS